jgi:hypothetical protein
MEGNGCCQHKCLDGFIKTDVSRQNGWYTGPASNRVLPESKYGSVITWTYLTVHVTQLKGRYVKQAQGDTTRKFLFNNCPQVTAIYANYCAETSRISLLNALRNTVYVKASVTIRFHRHTCNVFSCYTIRAAICTKKILGEICDTCFLLHV